MALDSHLPNKASLLALLCWVGLFQAPAVASEVEFPVTTGGVEEIKRLVADAKAEGRTEYQTMEVQKGAFLFLVSHNRGGSVESNYLYVYGCDGFYCQLLGMRHSGKERLVGALGERGTELVLRSKGKVFLRMPLLLE